MKVLIETLQKHPLAILVMFLVSAVSGIMGIVLGWQQFYESYLSRSVQLPVWLLLFGAGLIATLYFLKPYASRKPRELEMVQGKSFGVQPVELDGKRFVNCTFDGSELIFRATNGFDLIKNDFKVPPRLRFEAYAGVTLAALKALNNDPNFRQYVTAALQASPPDA